MRLFFSLAAIVLLSCGTLCAAEIPAITLPPDVAGDVGDFITVQAESEGPIVEWVPAPGLKLFPVDLLRDSRTAVVTAPRAGEYVLMAYTAKGDVPSKLARVVVKVGPPQPTPVPPGPTPPGPVPPTPVPPSPIPDGAHGLTRWAYDLVLAIPVASRANAAGVATNLESVAAAAAAGTIPNQQKMFEDMKARNAVTLANDRVAWTPFAEAFRVKLNELIKTGKLNTVDDVGAAFREVAEGMRLAAGGAK